MVLKQSFRSNFGVKAAEIADRKSIRIALIRMDLRSLAGRRFERAFTLEIPSKTLFKDH